VPSSLRIADASSNASAMQSDPVSFGSNFMVSYRERGIEMPFLRLACCGLSLGLLLVITGCKGRPHSVEHAEISGKVLFQGKPLPGGVVNFVAVNGGFANTGVIDENGNYQLKAPVGEVRIGVSNKMLRSGAPTKEGGQKKEPKTAREEKTADQKKGQRGVKGRYVDIPPSYTDPSTSGLTYTVKPGAQTHDIELSANPSAAPGAPGQ
jgi:hypothetical protein